jgi:hypothetical protein
MDFNTCLLPLRDVCRGRRSLILQIPIFTADFCWGQTDYSFNIQDIAIFIKHKGT